MRYLWNFGLSLPDGEEVIHEVFLELYQHLKCGRPEADVRVWLFRAVHNLALKIEAPTHRDTSPNAHLAGLPIDSGANSGDGTLTPPYRARVLRLMGTLPELDRRCLLLRAEGLRYREIDEVLAMPPGSASRALARSLGKLVRAAEE